MLSNYPQFLTVLSLVALIVIIWWFRTIASEERLARAGFGAILGGAIGNLLDRLFRGGFSVGTYVVDFIDVHWYDRWHWPTFNLADSAICVHIGLVIVAHLRASPATANSKPEVAVKEAAGETGRE